MCLLLARRCLKAPLSSELRPAPCTVGIDQGAHRTLVTAWHRVHRRPAAFQERLDRRPLRAARVCLTDHLVLILGGRGQVGVDRLPPPRTLAAVRVTAVQRRAMLADAVRRNDDFLDRPVNQV